MSGEEVVIPASATARGVPAFAARPQGATRGMVVIHEILGRQPEIDRVVLRFAGHGYAAVAPDLFSRGFRPLCIRRAVQAIASGEGEQLEQIRAARSWLCARAGLAEEKVGLIGFCLGGGFALSAGRGWGAVSTNYGDVPKTEVLRGIGPVIGCYAGRDRLFGKSGAKLRAALSPLSVELEVHDFPTVGHSFLTDGEHPILSLLSRSTLRLHLADPAVREEGWRKILAFFERHLGH